MNFSGAVDRESCFRNWCEKNFIFQTTKRDVLSRRFGQMRCQSTIIPAHWKASSLIARENRTLSHFGGLGKGVLPPSSLYCSFNGYRQGEGQALPTTGCKMEPDFSLPFPPLPSSVMLRDPTHHGGFRSTVTYFHFLLIITI